MTTDECEARALADYWAARGKIFLARVVEGYHDGEPRESAPDPFWNVTTYHDGDSVCVRCEPPARVRIADTDLQNICRWSDVTWLDSEWEVDLVEPHPALATVRNLFVDGTSYSTMGDIEPNEDIALDTNQEPALAPIPEPELVRSPFE